MLELWHIKNACFSFYRSFLNFYLLIYYYLCHYSYSHFFSLFPSPFNSFISPSSVNPLIVVCIHRSFRNTLWLIAWPSVIQSTPTPLAAVSLFHVSMILFLFCSLVYCVQYIPHIIEIMWYFFFTGLLISLSIIFSRFIHAVTKGKSPFFFTAV